MHRNVRLMTAREILEELVLASRGAGQPGTAQIVDQAASAQSYQQALDDLAAIGEALGYPDVARPESPAVMAEHWRRCVVIAMDALKLLTPVSYTHLTLPTNREV